MARHTGTAAMTMAVSQATANSIKYARRALAGSQSLYIERPQIVGANKHRPPQESSAFQQQLIELDMNTPEQALQLRLIASATPALTWALTESSVPGA